ncbi:MAG: TIGR04086 family membrane protein [Bacillota bacterium]
MKRRTRTVSKGQQPVSSATLDLLGILRSVLIGWIWTAALILILTLLVHWTRLSDKIIPLSTLIIGLLSSAIAGYAAAARARHRGLVHGALAGLLYGLLLVIGGVFFLPNPVGALDMIWKLATLLLAGAIGGVLGV